MRLASVCLLGLSSPAIASFIPSPGQIFEGADRLLYGSGASKTLVIDHDYYDATIHERRKKCTLTSFGEGQDDTDNFLEAVKECGKGGIITVAEDI